LTGCHRWSPRKGTVVKLRLLPIIFAFLTFSSIAGVAQTDLPAKNAETRHAPLPTWLKSGTVRFARFDGGPLETQKASRTAWGSRFTPQDFDVLTKLYGEHGDHMVGLLQQAGINFVWVTYSVGFSQKDEEAQRVAVREIVKKLHAHGIKAAAYVCAISVFWQSMFKDVPQSVKWLMFDSQGVPYRYSDGQDPLRFIADIDNPDWVEYQKLRVGGIIDDGLDAIFFDNTNIDYHSNSEASVSRFLEEMVDYTRQQKHSDIPLFTNLGLGAQFILLNRTMDFVFGESWVEPGVWGEQWDVSNLRRNRLLRGLNPGNKPFVTEYSLFHKGDRNDSFLDVHSQKLAIAEAAALGMSYTWDMEGPFDTALITETPKALESWSAIGQYNGFLADHASLYADAVNVTPWMVLLPGNLDPDFGWAGTVPRLDLLSKNSVLCDYKLAGRVTKQDLATYQGVIVPTYTSLPSEHQQMIRDYQAGGGKVFVFPERSGATGLKAEILPVSDESSAKGKTSETQILAEISSLAPGATRVELEGPPNHVLANVTSVQDGGGLVVHLLNYDQSPVTSGLKLKLVLGKDFHNFAGRKPTLFSPDSTNSVMQKVQWRGSTLEATLPSIASYSVVVLQ
jgi:hypothetical protein